MNPGAELIANADILRQGLASFSYLLSSIPGEGLSCQSALQQLGTDYQALLFPQIVKVHTTNGTFDSNSLSAVTLWTVQIRNWYIAQPN